MLPFKPGTEGRWRWNATIDDATCPTCKELDGKELPPDVAYDQLPLHRECTNPSGCRCWADKEQPWKN